MRPNEKLKSWIRPEDLPLTSIDKGKLTVEGDTPIIPWSSLRNHLLRRKWQRMDDSPNLVKQKLDLKWAYTSNLHDIHVMRVLEKVKKTSTLV